MLETFLFDEASLLVQTDLTSIYLVKVLQ